MKPDPKGWEDEPPANQDGTPNETLADQAVRLRQVMSSEYYSTDFLLVPYMVGAL